MFIDGFKIYRTMAEDEDRSKRSVQVINHQRHAIYTLQKVRNLFVKVF